jgi:hypothetical protein
MKKITPLVLLAAAVLSLASCGKDESPESRYFMRFKADGKTYEFKDNTFAIYATSELNHALSMSGTEVGSNVVLQIFKNDTIPPGTYTESLDLTLNHPMGVVAFSSPDGDMYTSAFVMNGGKAVITFERPNASEASGTFSATVQVGGKPDLEITEGEFLLEWRSAP